MEALCCALAACRSSSVITILQNRGRSLPCTPRWPIGSVAGGRPAAGACTGLWTNSHVASLRVSLVCISCPAGGGASQPDAPAPLCPLGLKAPTLLSGRCEPVCSQHPHLPAPDRGSCEAPKTSGWHGHTGVGLHRPHICWQLQVRAAVAARRAAQQGGALAGLQHAARQHPLCNCPRSSIPAAFGCREASRGSSPARSTCGPATIVGTPAIPSTLLLQQIYGRQSPRGPPPGARQWPMAAC